MIMPALSTVSSASADSGMCVAVKAKRPRLSRALRRHEVSRASGSRSNAIPPPPRDHPGLNEIRHGRLTLAISGGAQSARRLPIETFQARLQFLQAA